MHLLVKLGDRGKQKLRSFASDGNDHLLDLEAALRRATVLVTSQDMYTGSEALAIGIVGEESRDGPFSKAREWLNDVDTYACGYLPELNSIVRSSQPPQEHVTETLRGNGLAADVYWTAFMDAVEQRVRAIDRLFNHPIYIPPDSDQTAALTLRPPEPPAMGPVRTHEEAVNLVKAEKESVQVLQKSGSPEPEALGHQPASAAHASVKVAEAHKVATVLNVLIASPGDVAADRKAVEDVIQTWNRKQQHLDRKTILLPQMWEWDAIPMVGRGDGQQEINRQLADRSDIVFGLFRGRLGAPTARHVSGTAEEIERSIRRGIPVHVFHSAERPAGDNPDQLSAMHDYLKKLQKRGLVGRYASLEDLQKRVLSALEQDVRSLLGE